ncbi:MAG: type II secretion system F family protein [Candidatus Omnitrophica bacterium]|nr:type II secretion system F family protein [Candidatus Omnitrophota bacterium]
MAQYDYQARDKSGRLEKGAVEAPNPDEALTILQAKELLVVSIRERQKGQAAVRAPGRAKRMHGGVKSSDLIVMARSLSAMTEAGLPLLKAMETVSAQIRSRKLHDAIQEVIRDIRGGFTFRDAIAKHPTVFSALWVSLVETGEASGQLTKSLEQISVHLEKAGAIQRKVVSALIYPVILLTVAVFAVLIFTLKIIPTFASMFESFGAELPLLTRMVIWVSDFIRGFIVLILLAAAGAGFAVSRWLKTQTGRWQFDSFRLWMPVFGPVFQGVSAQQFASNLGTLLRAGVPILHALEIVIATSDNKVVAAAIEEMRSGVREGKPLAEPLAESDIFPPMVAQMLAVGEQTGKLPDMLSELEKHYEEQVSTSVARMTALLEPIMLVGMGLVIGVLVISMYLPIFQLTSVVKG